MNVLTSQGTASSGESPPDFAPSHPLWGQILTLDVILFESEVRREIIVDYICYISHSKIDQLYEQLNPEVVIEHTERVTSEHQKTSSVSAGVSFAGLASLFKGGITYGRNDVLQRDKKIKLAYTEKLRDVLLAIAADHGDIPDIGEAVTANCEGDLYYFYSGTFRVDPLRNPPRIQDVVTISSRLGQYQLDLDCSIRYFSESTGNDSKFLIHSGNSAFFSGRVQLHFSTVFILLGISEYCVLGTPLYLQLSVPSLAHHSL